MLILAILGSQDNSMTEIRSSVGGNVEASQTIPAPLHCSEYREFWVSWGSTFISVGEAGQVGEGMHARWSSDTDPLNPIHSIALATEEGVTGRWVHGNVNGMTLVPGV